MMKRENWCLHLSQLDVDATKLVVNRVKFSQNYLASVRATCFELSHSEVDMAILGQLMGGMNNSSDVSTLA